MKQDKHSAPTLKRLGFLVNRTSWAMRRKVQATIHSEGFFLSPEQWIAVNLLFEMGEMTQTELSWIMNTEKASITRIVDSLAGQKLVERKPFPEDRRKHLVALSEAGVKLREELAPKIISQYQKMVAGISEGDKEIVTRVLAQICEQAK